MRRDNNYVDVADKWRFSVCTHHPLGSQPAADMANISTNNNTLSINNYYDYAERPETYIVPALFAIIFVIGMIGNVTLVLIFVRNKQMRNVPNIYIINLALGDLLVIISCVPFTSTVYTVRIQNLNPRQLLYYNIMHLILYDIHNIVKYSIRDD